MSKPRGKFIKLIGLVVFFIVLGAIVLLCLLPDPKKMTSEYLEQNGRPRLALLSPKLQRQKAEGHAPEAIGQKWDPYPLEARRRDEISNKYLLKRILSAPDAEPNPCKYLDNVRDLKGLKGYFIKDEMVEVAEGRKAGDPYVELVLIPLRQILLQTRLGHVASLVKDIQKGKEMSLSEKATFWKEVGLALTDLIRKKELFDNALDHTYLTYSLFSLLREHPGLISGQDAEGLCATLSNPNTDYRHKKEEFENLVRSLGINFTSIMYNPNYKSDLSVHKKGSWEFQIGGSWMDVFKLL